MAKLTLSSIPSGYATAAAHNADNTAIETAIENTLSRDGTGPNQMEANLDMNGYAILNQRATSGNENFIWMGTWATGTTYSVNNLVYAPEGTNLGNTLICVTANIAGATLDGDAAKWAVFAQRGASGAGTGDVNGPASSTADSLARFSGTTGKLLKDGAVIGTDVQAYSAKLASYVSNTLTAANKIPYSTALNTASELTLDTDGTLFSNSDTSIPTQKAIKTYVDTSVSGVSIYTLATPVTASGTTINFNSIPTGTKRITVMFAGLSSSGTSQIIVRIGDSGGLETTGYIGASGVMQTGVAITNLSDGFLVGTGTTSTYVLSGSMILTLLNGTTNTWVIQGIIGQSDTSRITMIGGYKSLTAELDRLTVTTSGGVDTFDAGTVNISYE